MNKQLNIQWNFHLPPISATEWHTWSGPDAQVYEVDEIILMACKKGLNRFHGWDLSRIEPKALNQWVLAASIYKRGVMTRIDHQPQKSLNISGAYNIHFSENQSIPWKYLPKESFYVIDKNVLEAWPELKKLRYTITTNLTEANKNFASVKMIENEWIKFNRPCDWVIIGGGITGDTAAFAANLNQCQFKLVPTTLLAMADACIGGKTGVNVKGHGKNQIGRFAFPSEVLCWSGWLKTLPKREFKAGLAECLKHGLLANDPIILNNPNQYKSAENIQLSWLKQVVQVKSKVVAQDPAEQGVRATLNLGHTLAHALEAISHEQDSSEYLHHGEAVAIGLLFASYLSYYVKICEYSTHEKVEKTLKSSDCLIAPKMLMEYTGHKNLESAEFWDHIMKYLQKDKKNRGSHSHWVLLKELGETATQNNSPTIPLEYSTVQRAWNSFINKYP